MSFVILLLLTFQHLNLRTILPTYLSLEKTHDQPFTDIKKRPLYDNIEALIDKLTWRFQDQPLDDWELRLLTKQIEDKLNQNIQLSTRVRTLLDKIEQTPEYFEETRDFLTPAQIISSHLEGATAKITITLI